MKPPGRRGGRGANGTVTVLVLGFVVVLMLLVAAVVDASAAYLRRRSMASLADGAVLAAADGVQGEQVYTSGLGGQAEIDPLVAQAYVADYLDQTGATESYPGLSWQVSTAGTVVSVRVAAPLDLPVTPSGWVDDVTVEGEASAIVDVQ